MKSNFTICARCIYDSNVPGISFDEEGICNYCRQIEQLEEKYNTGTLEGLRKLEDLLSRIKSKGKNKKYDPHKSILS